jgi:hypothetical protein
VARIALDAIQPARVHRDDCSLHIYEIVFAQQLILSSEASNQCATSRASAQVHGGELFALIAATVKSPRI